MTFGQVDPAGMVLGTIQVLQGMASGSGFSCSSDVATYTPTSGPVDAEYRAIPAVAVSALLNDAAVIHLHAGFGDTPSGPYIANARFIVAEENGFDTFEAASLRFVPLPTPDGSWDDPKIFFDVYFDFRHSHADDSKGHFLLTLNRSGYLEASEPQFQGAACGVSWGYEPKIHLFYNVLDI